MQHMEIPWGVWYNDAPLKVEFSDHWQVQDCPMVGGADIGDEGIRRALAESIDALPLREFAKGKKSAAIVVDDLSRPTPAFRLLPYILQELEAAGLGEDQVKIHMCFGCTSADDPG
jgi:lactate racemase